MKITQFQIDAMGQIYLLGDDGIIRLAEMEHTENSQAFRVIQEEIKILR